MKKNIYFEIRKELKMTQCSLADYLGIVQQNISAWEHGISSPSKEIINKILILLSRKMGRDRYNYYRDEIVKELFPIIK